MVLKKSKLFVIVGLLLTGLFLLGGCSQEGPEVKAINDGILQFSKLNSGQVTIETQMEPEEGVLSNFNSQSESQLTFEMSRMGFNYLMISRDNAAGTTKNQKAVIKVVGGEETQFTLDENGDKVANSDRVRKVEDAFDRPGSIRFMYEKLKASQVANVETVEDATGQGRTGYKIYRDQKFLDKVNKGRDNNPELGLVLENNITYWLNSEGLLVGLDYFTRDKLTSDGKEDVVKMAIKYEVTAYDDPALADIINKN